MRKLGGNRITTGVSAAALAAVAAVGLTGCVEQGPNSGTNTMGEGYRGPETFKVLYLNLAPGSEGDRVHLSGCIDGDTATKSIVTLGTGYENMHDVSKASLIGRYVIWDSGRFQEAPAMPVVAAANMGPAELNNMVGGTFVTSVGDYRVECGLDLNLEDVAVTKPDGSEASFVPGQVVHRIIAGDNSQFMVLADSLG